jgi:hypothetical protein
MLNVTIRSYDEFHDTFEIQVRPYDMQNRPCSDEHLVKSLIPAILLPYIAPDLCAWTEDLPFDAVGQEFNLSLPTDQL